MKRILSLLLAVVLLLGVAACSGNTAGSPTPTPIKTPSSATPSSSEPSDEEKPVLGYPIVEDGSITLTWFYTIQQQAASVCDDLATNYSWTELQKKTGIKLDFHTNTDLAATEQFQLMIAGGDYTDLIYGGSQYTGGGDKAIEDGVFLRLNDLMDNYAPDYMGIINSNPDYIRDSMTDSGNRYIFCQIFEFIQYQYCGLLIRDDWLEDLSLERPETYDEMHDVLVSFRDNKSGPGPLDLYMTGIPTFNSVSGGYNVAAQYFIQDNGKVSCSVTGQDYYDYLSMLHEWYTEQLIDPDFVSNGTTAAFPNYTRMFENKTGVFEGFGGQMGSYYADNNLSSPESFYGPVQNLVKVKGTHTTVGANVPIVPQHGCAITTQCKNPEAAARFLNYLYTDEGYIIANYGIDGVTFEYDTAGQPQLMDWIVNPTTGINGWNMLVANLVGNGAMRYNWKRSSSEQSLKNFDMMDAKWGYIYESMLPGNLTYTSDEGSERAAIMADAKTYIDEMTAKFIMGVEPMSKWDEFQSTLKNIGIERALEITQHAVDRYYSR